MIMRSFLSRKYCFTAIFAIVGMLIPLRAECIERVFKAAHANEFPVPPKGSPVRLHQGVTVADPNYWFYRAEFRLMELRVTASGKINPLGRPVRNPEKFILAAQNRIIDLMLDIDRMLVIVTGPWNGGEWNV